jgi:hypothetical protein
MQADEVTPPPPLPTPPPARRGSGKRVLLVLLLLIAAFLGGYVPATWRARNAETALDKTQFELRLANLHRVLGVAAGEALRNNYASAGGSARVFFDGCTALTQSNAFANEPRTQVAFSSYAAQRNEIMVQLADANPQVKERLASMYLTMDGVLGRRVSSP